MPMAPRPPGTTHKRNGWAESDYVLAMRRAVTRLGGRFAMAQLLPELQAHEPAAGVARWVNSGYLGSQVGVWREAAEIELVAGPGRVYQVTGLWKVSKPVSQKASRPEKKAPASGPLTHSPTGSPT